MSPRKFFLHDETERRKWQEPDAILAEIGLQSGSTFVDIGCGNGFFALPAARIVGEKGKVYGLDVDVEFIRELKEKAAKEALRNLSLTVGEAEETILCDGCADVVFFGIDLHDFRDPARVLQNSKKMLKTGGRLVDLDWKKQIMEIGPPLAKRFSEEEATLLIQNGGFQVKTVKDAGPYHYIIVATP
jgi:ubiquinone/menaquinone biosynthesis C-methylase UbiE